MKFQTLGGIHKELGLTIFLKFVISPRTSPKLGLVLAQCEIDPSSLSVYSSSMQEKNPLWIFSQEMEQWRQLFIVVIAVMGLDFTWGN